ncbi:hypothetical protein LTR17_007010 [Elasticomyces elasticus]|nr:hypothetical protein LTR17_007010 [Elasticomyces elasticus]
MSSAVQASRSEKPEIYVWLVQKCDYDDGRDGEGRTTVCNVYADLASANEAAEALFDECYEPYAGQESKSQDDEDEDEDEAEDEEANSETGIRSHLNSDGCYERSHESDDCQWRDHYGNLNGEGSFSVSVEQFTLKGKIPTPQTCERR